MLPRFLMRRSTSYLASGAVLLGLIGAWATVRAAQQPATAPAQTAPAGGAAAAPDENDMLISKMRLQDIKGGTYFYAAAEATTPQLPELIPATMESLAAAMKENQIAPVSCAMTIYQGITQDPTRPFQVEMGFPVAPGTKPVGDFKVREVPGFHCATVIYSGAVTHIPEAYQQLFMEIFQAGLQPTGEIREMYLYFETPDSPNNVMLFMAGVK